MWKNSEKLNEYIHKEILKDFLERKNLISLDLNVESQNILVILYHFSKKMSVLLVPPLKLVNTYESIRGYV